MEGNKVIVCLVQILVDSWMQKFLEVFFTFRCRYLCMPCCGIFLDVVYVPYFLVYTSPWRPLYFLQICQDCHIVLSRELDHISNMEG